MEFHKFLDLYDEIIVHMMSLGALVDHQHILAISCTCRRFAEFVGLVAKYMMDNNLMSIDAHGVDSKHDELYYYRFGRLVESVVFGSDTLAPSIRELYLPGGDMIQYSPITPEEAYYDYRIAIEHDGTPYHHSGRHHPEDHPGYICGAVYFAHMDWDAILSDVSIYCVGYYSACDGVVYVIVDDAIFEIGPPHPELFASKKQSVMKHISRNWKLPWEPRN